jgi:uncharacterized phage protein gp47/JayE
MSYLPPSIGAAGLTLPAYQDILNLLIANFQNLYGPGVYLGTDSPDYQMLSIIALAQADGYNSVQLDYNNRTPTTAQGAALDGDVAYNGLIREAPSYSTCAVTIGGVAGTIITNGYVRDTVPGQGYQWNLPASVTIPPGGSLNTVVTCAVVGNVNAPASGAFTIGTPTSGWNTVTNSTAPSPGSPVETDAQLRARQAISTELPSETLLAGTAAAVAAVPGVSDSLCLENPTGSALTTWPIVSPNPTWFGPAHSITVIAEGGAALAIAEAVYFNKGIGCGINSGTYDSGAITPTSQAVIDPDTGQTFTIYFYIPVDLGIYVIVNTKSLSPAFTSTIKTAIETAVTNYLTSLAIGATVSWAAIMAVAMSQAGNLENPIYDITTLYIGTSSSPTGVVDIPMSYPMQTAAATSVVVN